MIKKILSVVSGSRSQLYASALTPQHFLPPTTVVLRLSSPLFIPYTLLINYFDLHQAQYLGVPDEACSIEYHPLQRILAVANEHGAIKMYVLIFC